MRHHYTIFCLLFALLATGACSDDSFYRNNEELLSEGKSFEVSFDSYADGMSTILTRADEDEINSIDNLRLLVFDEHRRFLYSRKAILEKVYNDDKPASDHLPGNSKDGITRMYRFTVQLVSSTKPRYIHFIAKHDWTGFQQDYFLEGKDAGQIIPDLTTQKNELWREIKFNRLQKTDFNSKVFKLLRNNARISLTIKNGIPDFTYEGFKVYNAYNKATVAPYIFKEEGYTYVFPETPDQPTVPPGAGIIDVAHGPFGTDPIDVFERFDRENDEQPLFLIMKGKYKATTAYYKIEMKKFNETTGVSSRYDIVRNYHYHVKVNAVNNKGYATEEEAVTKPAGNNIFASTELEDYPSVSDGTHTLTVNPLGQIFVKNGEFKSDILFTGGIDQVKIYPDWDGDNNEYLGKPVITNTGTNTGVLKIPVKKTPTDRELKFKVNVVARPTAGSNAGIITREITLILRYPYDFFAKLESDGSYSENKVRISFKVPPTIAKTAFPFNVYVKTKQLTPDLTQNDGMILEIRGGEYYYKYTVKSDAEIGKTIVLHFKRNENGKTETIELTSPYYKDETVILTSERVQEEQKTTGIRAYYHGGYYDDRRQWKWGDRYIPTDAQISVKGTTDSRYDNLLYIQMTSNGECMLVYPPNMPDNTSLKFTSSILGYTYTQTQSLKDLKSRKDIKLQLQQ